MSLERVKFRNKELNNFLKSSQRVFDTCIKMIDDQYRQIIVFVCKTMQEQNHLYQQDISKYSARLESLKQSIIDRMHKVEEKLKDLEFSPRKSFVPNNQLDKGINRNLMTLDRTPPKLQPQKSIPINCIKMNKKLPLTEGKVSDHKDEENKTPLKTPKYQKNSTSKQEQFRQSNTIKKEQIQSKQKLKQHSRSLSPKETTHFQRILNQYANKEKQQQQVNFLMNDPRASYGTKYMKKLKNEQLTKQDINKKDELRNLKKRSLSQDNKQQQLKQEQNVLQLSTLLSAIKQPQKFNQPLFKQQSSEFLPKSQIFLKELIVLAERGNNGIKKYISELRSIEEIEKQTKCFKAIQMTQIVKYRKTRSDDNSFYTCIIGSVLQFMINDDKRRNNLIDMIQSMQSPIIYFHKNDEDVNIPFSVQQILRDDMINFIWYLAHIKNVDKLYDMIANDEGIIYTLVIIMVRNIIANNLDIDTLEIAKEQNFNIKLSIYTFLELGFENNQAFFKVICKIFNINLCIFDLNDDGESPIENFQCQEPNAPTIFLLQDYDHYQICYQ